MCEPNNAKKNSVLSLDPVSGVASTLSVNDIGFSSAAASDDSSSVNTSGNPTSVTRAAPGWLSALRVLSAASYGTAASIIGRIAEVHWEYQHPPPQIPETQSKLKGVPL